ncbi:MAG: DNA primase small subunit domain-containing protein [Sulfolobales archaeon]
MSHQDKSSLVKDFFQKYYSKADLLLPDDLEYREFAYQPFGSESYVRHLSFKTRDEVIMYFTSKPPLHLYYSAATYLYPYVEDMEAKGWRGSDLLFDIDADHVPECISNNLIRKIRICPECESLSEEPEKECPNCSGETIDIIEPECIEYTKKYTQDLIDVLIEEFGISKKYIRVMFSGNRGFHVRVVDERFRSLGREERRIIADYILAKKSSLKKDFVGNKTLPLPPRIFDGGLRRRIARKIIDKTDSEVLRKYLISDNIEARDLLMKYSKEIYEEYIGLPEVSPEIPIDAMVTIDISRLVRIPNSINGKSGLLAVEIDPVKLSDFRFDPEKLSPFRDHRVLIEVFYKIPRIRIFGVEFRAYRETVYQVLGYVGVYLELKGLGRIKKVI